MESLTRYADATLPTPHGTFRLVVYRPTVIATEPRIEASGHTFAVEEHMALVLGKPRGQAAVLARVHSECFTGEVLGSLRCDCRDQLDAAMQRIASAGSGVIVYLRQEGRGIGLGNKVRAYALQDQGVDTVEANLALGFDADLRTYELAAAMLRDIGVASVRLMTNNPAKIDGLEAAGIQVASQESLWVGGTEHSEGYLKIKKLKMGHIEEQ